MDFSSELTQLPTPLILVFQSLAIIGLFYTLRLRRLEWAMICLGLQYLFFQLLRIKSENDKTDKKHEYQKHIKTSHALWSSSFLVMALGTHLYYQDSPNLSKRTLIILCLLFSLGSRRLMMNLGGSLLCVFSLPLFLGIYLLRFFISYPNPFRR